MIGVLQGEDVCDWNVRKIVEGTTLAHVARYHPEMQVHISLVIDVEALSCNQQEQKNVPKTV